MFGKRNIAFFIIALLLVFCIWGFHGRAHITIPDFPVTINGAEFEEQSYVEYPLLLYHGIVYFPMTYYQSSALDLKTEWTEKNGLVVTKTDAETPKIFSCYEQVDSKKNPWFSWLYWKFQRASIANAKVIIDGKEVNYEENPHPFLQFRNIIYIPLTRQFVEDELNGSYHFEEEEGLQLYCNVFFYTANGDSEIRDDGESVSVENETHYVKDDLRISMSTRNAHLIGPQKDNLSIINVNDGSEIRPEGYFGYFQKDGPLFTVEGKLIHTVYYTNPDYRDGQPCTIDTKTGEVFSEK